MRERRVGVTARSRQVEGNQATGSLQIASEIAAPLELRTPTSTAAKAAIRVRMEAWRTMALETMGQKANPKRVRGRTESGISGRGERRGKRAHEALPHTPPGGKPPETPGPLSLGVQLSERKESVKGSQAAQQQRALDRFPPF